jgi:hypothetical protein
MERSLGVKKEDLINKLNTNYSLPEFSSITENQGPAGGSATDCSTPVEVEVAITSTKRNSEVIIWTSCLYKPCWPQPFLTGFKTFPFIDSFLSIFTTAV